MSFLNYNNLLSWNFGTSSISDIWFLIIPNVWLQVGHAQVRQRGLGAGSALHRRVLRVRWVNINMNRKPEVLGKEYIKR